MISWQSSSGFDDVVADGVANEFAHRMALQPAHDVGAMRLGSLDADAQRDGHFFAALPLSQQLHDLALPWRQAAPPGVDFRRLEIAFQIAIENELRHFGGKKRLVAAQCLQMH